MITIFTLLAIAIFPIDNDLDKIWEFAKKFSKVDGPRPKIEIVQAFWDSRILGYCESAELIRISASLLDRDYPNYLLYVIGHEFIHAALFLKKIKADLHHCWMADHHSQKALALWIIQSFSEKDLYLFRDADMVEQGIMLLYGCDEGI